MEHVVITGANRGLGLALVEVYAKAGARVLATARQPQEAPELAALAAQYSQVSIYTLDVANDASIVAAAQAIMQAAPAIDVLINNAGMNKIPGTRGIPTLERDALLHLINVNALGALFVARELLAALLQGVNPRIVMISSQMGSMDFVRGGDGYGYPISKAAMNMSARVLAGDLGARGITTITLHPGWVQTDMGGASAPLTPQQSASSIQQVITGLTPRDNGSFLKWNGEVHAW